MLAFVSLMLHHDELHTGLTRSSAFVYSSDNDCYAGVMVSGGRAAELKDRIHSGQEDRRVGQLHFKTKL